MEIGIKQRQEKKLTGNGKNEKMEIGGMIETIGEKKIKEKGKGERKKGQKKKKDKEKRE